MKPTDQKCPVCQMHVNTLKLVRLYGINEDSTKQSDDPVTSSSILDNQPTIFNGSETGTAQIRHRSLHEVQSQYLSRQTNLTNPQTNIFDIISRLVDIILAPIRMVSDGLIRIISQPSQHPPNSLAAAIESICFYLMVFMVITGLFILLTIFLAFIISPKLGVVVVFVFGLAFYKQMNDGNLRRHR